MGNRGRIFTTLSAGYSAGMPPAIPSATVDRYRAVLAHAERGEGNEKENAKRLLAKMRQQYPGIDAVVDVEAVPSPGGWGGFTGSTPGQSGQGPSFRDIFNEAADFIRQAAADVDADAEAERLAAEYVRVGSRVREDGKVQVVVAIDARDVDRLLRLSSADVLGRVARHIGSEVAEELTAVLVEANAERVEAARPPKRRARR